MGKFGTGLDIIEGGVKQADTIADIAKMGGKATTSFDASKIGKMDFDTSGFKIAGGAAGTGGSAAGKVMKKTAGFVGDHFKELTVMGIMVGGGLYLENKYDEASEAMIECQGKCLPENYDLMPPYGTLEKKDLIYNTTVASKDQPVCTADHVDCGDYCGSKCEAIHDYDAPGTALLGGLAGDAGQIVNDALGGVFDGIDPSYIGMILGVFACLMMLGLMFKLKSMASGE